MQRLQITISRSVCWVQACGVDEVNNAAATTPSFSKSESKEDESSKAEPEVTSKDPPTEKDGYIAPKGGPRKARGRNGQVGWIDANGNIWVPAATGSRSAHGGGHRDVQSRGGNGYTNVYPGGKTRPGKGRPPKLPSWIDEIN